jgi:hypothetical protein
MAAASYFAVLCMLASVLTPSTAALLRSQRPFEDDVFLYDKPALLAQLNQSQQPIPPSSALSGSPDARSRSDTTVKEDAGEWARRVAMGQPMPTSPR